MTTHKWLLGFSLMVSVGAQARWNGIIVDTATNERISASALSVALSAMENIALGEKHYTPTIQKAQGDVIAGTVRAAHKEGRFTVGWEFLNRSEQEKIKALYARYLAGEITTQEFLFTTQGNDKAVSYAPILDATRTLRGEIIGVNLTRSEKSPAVQGGLGAMDPKNVPLGFHLGGKAYRDRFIEAMGGHGNGLENYFVAQCLTDAWLAHTLLTESKGDLRFLVAGSFHTDYHDGAVAELYERGKKASTRSLTFVDASDYIEAELVRLVHHEKYGVIADYVVFVGEPKP